MNDSKQKILNNYKEYINPAIVRLFRLTGVDYVEEAAEGVIVKDIEGKEFIDCLGSYGALSLGHRNYEVIKAVKMQLDKMALSSKLFFNKKLAELAELLATITPGKLKYSFISNSGTEAVEAALKFAKLYNNKRKKIVSTSGSFHGKTLGALSCSGREIYKKPFRPLLPNFIQVEFNNIAAIRAVLDDKVCACILEPIQGEGGVIVGKKSYLQEVAKLCKRYNIVLIIDEVQTGLGRCGYMFASEYFGIEPDILVLAKSLGGGVMPIGATIMTEEIVKPLTQYPLLHTSTFGGNPLACSAAIAAIKTMLRKKLYNRARIIGKYFFDKLSLLRKEYEDIIAEVRGLGLLIGMELKKEDYGGYLISQLVKNGVIVGYTLNNPKVIRFSPPLLIKKKEIDKVIVALDKALNKTAKFFF